MKNRIYSLIDNLKWDKAFRTMVISIAFPMFLQSILGQTLNLVDNLMVSRLGDAAYAGISQINRFSMVAYVMLFGVASGTSIYMSQFWGAGQINNMKRSNGLSIIWGLCISVPLMLVAIFATDFVVGLFLRPGQSADYAKQYLRTIAPMFPVFTVANSYSTILRSEEKTKYPMIASSVSLVMNTILNYLLIEGHFGFPRMEVEGAALATLISMTAQAIIMYYFAYTKSVAGKATFKEMFDLHIPFIRMFNKTSLPVIINETFWSVGVAVCSMFFGMRGDSAAAALGVYNTIDGLLFISIYSITSATSILVGKALGANDKENAVLYANRLSVGTMALSIVIGIIMLIFIDPILMIFGNLSEETLSAAKTIIIISIAVNWIRSYNSILIVAILRCGGDTIMCLVLDVAFLWGLAIPLLALATLYTDWPIHILYSITLIDELCKFVFGILRYKSGKWIKNLTTETA